VRATNRWATILLAAAAGACGRARETAAPPPAARVEDILGTSGAVAPRQSAEPRWVRIDSAESRTLWLDTANVERLAADTFAIRTAFRFPTPRPGGPAARGRRFVEGRFLQVIDCVDRRMRTQEYDTRDAAGAVVESGRVDSEWLLPFAGSGYANLIELACEFVGYPATRRPDTVRTPEIMRPPRG
jgi:hypothetical protein